MRTAQIAGAVVVALVARAAGAADTKAAPDARAGENARAAAMDMYTAFAHGDHERFVNDLYPPAVKAMGGRARVLTAVKSGMTEMHKNGMNVKSTVVEPPTQIVKVGKTGVQALLLAALIVTTARGDMKLPTYLVGVSEDAGKTWKFVDTGKVGNERLTKFFPALSPELKVPPKPAPEMLKK